jgi:hypothetical protein
MTGMNTKASALVALAFTGLLVAGCGPEGQGFELSVNGIHGPDGIDVGEIDIGTGTPRPVAIAAPAPPPPVPAPQPESPGLMHRLFGL